jgi:putative oxidoreductase
LRICTVPLKRRDTVLNTITTSESHTHPSKVWNTFLWIAQILLAIIFGMAGIMKMSRSITDLAHQLVWPGVVPPELVRFIGVAEFAAAVGLILPAATRIRPALTPLAALGLVVVMVLAAGFHISRGEYQALPMNILFGIIASFVAWGRFRKVPIAPKIS